jgi:hypothetical protein
MTADECLEIARGLMNAGDFSAAERQLSGHDLGDIRVAVEFARCASKAGDWEEALKRWNRAHDLNPTIDATGNERGIARMHLQEDIVLTGSRGPVQIERVEDPAAQALVGQFESLGENCEFGLLQRRFQAEPLGLLRWTYTGPRTLITLLETKFRGFANLSNLALSRASWGEYFIKETAAHVTFHTYLTDCGSDESAFLRKQCVRLEWLRGKLLDDLQAGEKTFVYKVHHSGPPDVMQRIYDLLRGYGRNRLLCVRASEGQRPGTIETAPDGLMTGYLSRVQPPETGGWNIAYDEWLSICHAAQFTDDDKP